MAATALGASMVAAAPANASATFLYKEWAGIAKNCTGSNRELQNDGQVAIPRYTYSTRYLGSSVHGIFTTYSWQNLSSTAADKQLWCYNGSYYYYYYARNFWSRTHYSTSVCYSLGCYPYSQRNTPWKYLGPGL